MNDFAQFNPVVGNAPDLNGGRGAYGVAVTGLEAEDHLLILAEPDWPTLRIVIDPAPAEAGGTHLTDDLARFPEIPTGYGEVDRQAGVALFRGVDGLSSDEIVHPRLGMLAALYAQWLPGRMAFHAGAFVTAGRAWGVVGERFDGKSTLMAALALSGVEVLGDDTLVLEGLHCLPGVRCVDLRPDAAVELGLEDAAANVRRGWRHRLPLDGTPTPVPLAGWFFLTWADELSVRALPIPERIARIGSRQGWHRRGVTDSAGLLEVAALPAWELSRPRDWGQLPRVLERVRELAG
jgi:hypothetical protein